MKKGGEDERTRGCGKEERRRGGGKETKREGEEERKGGKVKQRSR